jgi:hypothetical protein
MKPSTPIRELFEKHFIPEPNSGCWLWTATICDCRNKGRLNKRKGAKNSNAKLTEDQAMEIKKSSEPNTVLAKRFGVSPGLVSNIKYSRGWAHLP